MLDRKTIGKISIFGLVSLFLFTCCMLSRELIGELYWQTDFISTHRISNTGAAFGILQDNTSAIITISLIVVTIVLGYLIRNFKKLSMPQILVYAVFLSGVFANLAERMFFGHVLDYIKLEFVHFPVFNFADVLITIGTMLIIFDLLQPQKDDSKNA